MSRNKRKRSPNWLSSEKELLLSLVEFHFNIIENKKTDGVAMESKLAQWKVIADQYNSRTSHCFRTAENLKAQWDCMKKAARKDATNNRRHVIQTGGGSPIRPKKEDPFFQRILCLLSTRAVGLFNPNDSDSIIPAVQDQTAIPSVETEDFPESPPAQYKGLNKPDLPNSTRSRVDAYLHASTLDNIYLDTVQIIRKVKERPVLWNLSHEFYRDKDSRQVAWLAICRALFQHFDDYGPEAMFKAIRKVQMRWKIARDCYLKVKANEMNKSSSKKNVQNYFYYDHLTFLDSAGGGVKPNEILEDSNDEEVISLDNDGTDQETNIPDPLYTRPSSGPDQSSIKTENESENESICTTDNPPTSPHFRREQTKETNDNDDADDDMLFFRSVIPTLKKFTTYQKLMFRGKIISCLMEVERAKIVAKRNMRREIKKNNR